jgi:hypothetical protein
MRFGTERNSEGIDRAVEQGSQRMLQWRTSRAVHLLIHHTGMRIGECDDLSFDCLRSTGPNQWAIHVPLGNLKTERMVPVDSFVGELDRRLQFFRSLDPLPADGSAPGPSAH